MNIRRDWLLGMTPAFDTCIWTYSPTWLLFLLFALCLLRFALCIFQVSGFTTPISMAHGISGIFYSLVLHWVD